MASVTYPALNFANLSKISGISLAENSVKSRQISLFLAGKLARLGQSGSFFVSQLRSWEFTHAVAVFLLILLLLNGLNKIRSLEVTTSLFKEVEGRAMSELNRRKPKGDGGKGTGKKMSRQFATNVTTIYDILRQLATFYDNFHLFFHWHKTS